MPNSRPRFAGSRTRHAIALVRRPTALFRLMFDRGAPLMPRMIALFAVLYVVMPIDLIPDFVPIFGWLDDIGVTAIAMSYVLAKAAAYGDAQAGKDREILVNARSVDA
jgi:uncharacterized membrane protein YkvA (DUF1232 family)